MSTGITCMLRTQYSFNFNHGLWAFDTIRGPAATYCKNDLYREGHCWIFITKNWTKKKCKLEILFFMICMAAILIIHSQHKVQITHWSPEPKFWSLCVINFAVMCNYWVITLYTYNHCHFTSDHYEIHQALSVAWPSPDLSQKLEVSTRQM